MTGAPGIIADTYAEAGPLAAARFTLDAILDAHEKGHYGAIGALIERWREVEDGARSGKWDRPRFYLVTAQLEHTNGIWGGSLQIPQFLLDADVLGIVSTAHAEQIAGEMIRRMVEVFPVHKGCSITPHVTAVPVSLEDINGG